MYVFDIKQQLKRILGDKRYAEHIKKIRPLNDIIKDVYDGKIYKEFFAKNSDDIQKGATFSYTLNADGIAMCNKSKLSLTPVILAINELPLGERFCIENVVIAGEYLISIRPLPISPVRVNI